MAVDGVHVRGLEELKARFREIPQQLRKRYLRNWLAAGARVVRDEARRRAPVLAKPSPYRKPGTVRDAISVRTSKVARRAGEVGVFVNVKPLGKAQIRSFKAGGGGSGYKNPNDPYYWRWLEFGRAGRPGAEERQRVRRVKRTVAGKTVELVRGVRFRRALRAVGPMRAFGFLRSGAARLPDALRMFEAAAARWIGKVNASGKVD